MSKMQKILMSVSAVLLALIYFFPLWEITLFAPQYPEGLSFQIWINKMSGELSNVNILNHYIGMALIEPNSIPELVFMPYVLGFIIAVGFSTLIFKKRFLIYTYAGLLLAFLVLGFIDMYKWGYDYGHNLSPDAPIKVPGMTYQPPLIGSKILLNITAYSLPATGGIFLGIAFALACLALWTHKWVPSEKR